MQKLAMMIDEEEEIGISGTGMGDLSRNLSRYEISCKCGCGYDSIDAETLRVFQECIDHIQRNSETRLVVDVHSGCRCFAWNDHEGGADNSYHLKARAIDFSIRGIDPTLVSLYLSRKYRGKYGVGNYPTFTHLDTRTDGTWRQDC